MVECESIMIQIFVEPTPVLIDTWWNVNTQTRKRIALHHIVLIDTWWNVNSGGCFKKEVITWF